MSSTLHRIFHWFTACWHYNQPPLLKRSRCKINPTYAEHAKKCCICGKIAEHQIYYY